MKLEQLGLLMALIMVSGIAYGAVPDYIEVSEQPEVIAPGACTTITAQLMTDSGDPVRTCFPDKITCQSQREYIIVVSDSDPNKVDIKTASANVDAFGRVSFEFCSAGDKLQNLGTTDVICRAAQVAEGSSPVTVAWHVPEQLLLDKCPDGGSNPDIVADGESNVIISAQLMDDWDGSSSITPLDHPVKRANIDVTFTVGDTSIVKPCGSSTGAVTVPTNPQGFATAYFCSSGSGSNNIGSTTVTVTASNGGAVITPNTISVETTGTKGTTTTGGKLKVSALPSEVLYDDYSTSIICAQLRDKDNKIVHRIDTVSFLSGDELLFPVNQLDPYNPYHTANDTNSKGVTLAEFKTTGKLSTNIPNPEATVTVTADTSATSSKSTSIAVDTFGIWGESISLFPTPSTLICDGQSRAVFTAQLIDRHGVPVKQQGKNIVFKSHDTTKLKTLDEHAIVTKTTNGYGQAKAEFITSDCKFGGNTGDAEVEVSMLSPAVSEYGYVNIVSPDGLVPNGVNTYTDHTTRHSDLATISHAAPSLIAVDGESKVQVTAQVCEWDMSHQFCNPAKREGILVEFTVLDSNIVQNKGDNPGAVTEGIDYVDMYTNKQGTATAVFRSTGTTHPTNEGCTDILVEAVDGHSLGTARATVCTDQDSVNAPNAMWVWAEPAFVTADGVSETELKAALYWCDEYMLSNAGFGSGMWDQSTITPTDLHTHCDPVAKESQNIKFETDSPLIMQDPNDEDNRRDEPTDQYGVARAIFKSGGYGIPNIGPTQISTWYLGTDTVLTLNELFVTTMEKTYPWCVMNTFTPGSGADLVDVDDDGIITDTELLQAIFKWFNGESPFDDPDSNVNDTLLLNAIYEWASQYGG